MARGIYELQRQVSRETSELIGYTRSLKDSLSKLRGHAEKIKGDLTFYIAEDTMSEKSREEFEKRISEYEKRIGENNRSEHPLSGHPLSADIYSLIVDVQYWKHIVMHLPGQKHGVDLPDFWDKTGSVNRLYSSLDELEKDLGESCNAVGISKKREDIMREVPSIIGRLKHLKNVYDGQMKPIIADIFKGIYAKAAEERNETKESHQESEERKRQLVDRLGRLKFVFIFLAISAPAMLGFGMLSLPNTATTGRFVDVFYFSNVAANFIFAVVITISLYLLLGRKQNISN